MKLKTFLMMMGFRITDKDMTKKQRKTQAKYLWCPSRRKNRTAKIHARHWFACIGSQPLNKRLQDGI